MPKKEKDKVKIQKNVELVSMIASQIEEMNDGERIRITPFAKSIQMSTGSHPHVETIKGKVTEASLWQGITKKVKFYKKDNQIVEIEKVSDDENSDIEIIKEIRNDLNIIKNKIEHLEKKNKDLKESFIQLQKSNHPILTKLDRIENAVKERK